MSEIWYLLIKLIGFKKQFSLPFPDIYLNVVASAHVIFGDLEYSSPKCVKALMRMQNCTPNATQAIAITFNLSDHWSLSCQQILIES